MSDDYRVHVDNLAAQRLGAVRGQYHDGGLWASSEARALDASAGQDRLWRAGRRHANQDEKVLVHHGTAGETALVTRMLDDHLFVMTEQESFRHFGPHSPRSRPPQNAAEAVAHVASEMGCMVIVLGVLALIGFFLWLMVVDPSGG